MKFGFEPVCDQLGAGSSYLDIETAELEPAQSWSQTGSKLVADLLRTCFEPVCDQLRTR